MTIDLQAQLVDALNKLNERLERPSYKIIVSPNEINYNHGVGIFLQRLFPDTGDIYSVRSIDVYGGDHSFGSQSFCLHQQHAAFHDVLNAVNINLGQIRASAILLVPYFPADFLLGLALKRLYGCPLCVFIMDDQNIYSNSVEDQLVRQLLDSADLCFGISRPLCDDYERKYNKRFWFFPPVVESRLIQRTSPDPLFAQRKSVSKGVLIGNIWSQRWLDQLRILCRESNVKIDWYGNPNRNWIDFEESELEADGIFFRGFIDEAELIQVLKKASYALILTGSTDHPDDRPEQMKLSLPSRCCFMTATANIPLLVLGHHESAIARFVESAALGVISPYNHDDFVAAIEDVCSPENQRRFRENSFAVASQLGADGLGEWLWDSLTLKRPVDLRFEQLWPKGIDHYQSVLVTTSENNFRHGTGVLLKRVFPHEHNIISVRTNDFYFGDQQWEGESYLIQESASDRRGMFSHVVSIFKNHSCITRLFCVPYDAESLLVSIAIKEFYGIPMAIWIMDDQNVATPKVPDTLMKEFLSKADVRFATHPEMRDAYENKYGLKFWLLPAVVPDHIITTIPSEPAKKNFEERRGALVGSLWSEQWFNSLCHCLQQTGIQLDWFGNSQYYWFTDTDADLRQKGLNPKGICPEDPLAKNLKDYPFVIVPTGTLDERDDQVHLSRLSLPGRILFILASSNTPIILLGSPLTSAGNFVNRFQIGMVCDYTPEALSEALEYVLDPSNQKRLRQNAINVARRFSDRGIDEWIWQSLEMGQAADRRFESLFQRSTLDSTPFIEPPVPDTICRDYVPAFLALRRLKSNGYNPDFVLEVGASTGIWSNTVSLLFPDAAFILIDLAIRHHEQPELKDSIKSLPNSKLLELTISHQMDQCNEVGQRNVDPGDPESVSVEMKTLDQLVHEEKIIGRGILKLDLQSIKYLVLEGAQQFIEQVDLIIVELSLPPFNGESDLFLQILNKLDSLDFRYYDEAGEIRSPVDGTLHLKNVAFIRRNLLIHQLATD